MHWRNGERDIEGEAASAGVPLIFGELAKQRFREATDQGLAEEDMAALVRPWEGTARTTVAAAASGPTGTR